MYQPQRPSRSEFVPIRKLRYHVRLWGEPTAGVPPLVMVHGWMDVSASWQFVVDALAQDRFIIAPDWRGFGLTDTPQADHYVFADYLADLDFLLDHYAGDTPVDLVGHSMGGQVATLYAGARPQRIRRLVNLEGFGMPATPPAEAPRRIGQWIDELKSAQRGELELKHYESVDGVARRLMKTNARLPQDKATWLAQHWARCGEDGLWRVLGDPAHKVTNFQLFRLEETLEHYKAITAPTLWVEASDDSLAKWFGERFTLAEFHERLRCIAQLNKAVVQDAGHMLHHDQPQALAQLLTSHLSCL